jgi:hypothetical protein
MEQAADQRVYMRCQQEDKNPKEIVDEYQTNMNPQKLPGHLWHQGT